MCIFFHKEFSLKIILFKLVIYRILLKEISIVNIIDLLIDILALS